jgi:hypothetical protein
VAPGRQQAASEAAGLLQDELGCSSSNSQPVGGHASCPMFGPAAAGAALIQGQPAGSSPEQGHARCQLTGVEAGGLDADAREDGSQGGIRSAAVSLKRLYGVAAAASTKLTVGTAGARQIRGPVSSALRWAESLCS